MTLILSVLRQLIQRQGVVRQNIIVRNAAETAELRDGGGAGQVRELFVVEVAFRGESVVRADFAIVHALKRPAVQVA